MRNLKVCISYNGSAYHGFQRQNNAPSVQQTVEEAMSKLLGQSVTINGCSRTDTGVHAKEFYFNAKIDNNIPCEGFIKGMNSLLPHDIAVHSCVDESNDFHARYCSKGKEYIYIVNMAPVRDVFSGKLALHYQGELDTEKMNRAAELFVGEHDFAAFCKAEAKEHLKSTVRTVTAFSVHREGNKAVFTVRGNGFLHNMVRIMVGTLIYISEGKRTEEDIIRALETGDREAAGKTIPPEGLYLNKVFYDQ